MKRILIVDDDKAVTNYFNVFLMQTGIFESTILNDSRKVSDLLNAEVFDVILLDLDMPEVSGLDILQDIQKKKIRTPVIILTGVSDVNLAVKAMKYGAFEYLVKPVDEEKLLEILDNAIEHGKLYYNIDQLPNQLKRENLDNKSAFSGLISINSQMIRLFYEVEKMADSDLSIFIWGETGTGKRTLASAIHNAGNRKEQPFLYVNINMQDPDNLPGYLFGQAKNWNGSKEESMGIIQKAGGGTIFINHVETLSLSLQARLNNVLQSGKYYSESSTEIKNADVRFIVASTYDLSTPEYKDKFSQDLLHRLSINSVEIPPLRERKEDIEYLTNSFLHTKNKNEQNHIKGFTADFIKMLNNYKFPGNVKELKSIILYSIYNEESDFLSADSIPYSIRAAVKLGKENIYKPEALNKIIIKEIKAAMNYFNQDKERTADALKITVNEIKKYLEGP